MNNDNNNTQEYEDVCNICRRPQSKAGKMIHIADGVCVCNDCIQKAIDSMPMLTPFLSGQGMPFDILGSLMPGGADGSAAEDADEAGDEAPGTENAAAEEATDSAAEVSADEQKEEDVPDPDGEEPSSDQKKKKNSSPRINVRMIDLTQMGPFGMQIPERQRVKKRTENKKPDFTMKDVPAPHKIKAMLDEYVVGQEMAKKSISVAVYNHYKRILSDNSDGVEIRKSNMMLIGPTGSGKTYLVQTLAKLLNVPLAIADATSLTEAGYIGDDIESVLSKLLAAADNDVDKAETGIVFIDEIDKIAKKHNANTRDVSGESVQQELLKLLEGSRVDVPVGAGSKNGMVPMATMDTGNILFICGGAFPDLTGVIRERLTKNGSMGFGARLKGLESEEEILSQVKTEDLRKFGMIPEFLGRLPVVVTLKPLNKEALIRILKEPKNAILKQYRKLLAMDEVDLVFEDDALAVIAEKALEQDTGARALRAIIEEFMLDIMYEIPKDPNIGRVIITADYLKGTGGPGIEFRGQPALPGGEYHE